MSLWFLYRVSVYSYSVAVFQILYGCKKNGKGKVANELVELSYHIMRLDHLYDDVFQSMLDYLEYEEIARLSKASYDAFVMCDDYVHRDVGASVADLYHFTDNCDCEANALRVQDSRTAVAGPLLDSRTAVARPLLDSRTAVAGPLLDSRTAVARPQKIEIGEDLLAWVAPATIYY